MMMDIEVIKKAVKSQYEASLIMLKQAVMACPPSLWNEHKSKNQFWHIAYHALFYAHLYLQDSEKAFIPWNKHKNESQFLGSSPGKKDANPAKLEPYRKEEILEYADICLQEVDRKIPELEVEAPSGFHWLHFNKLELHLYNIRHIQHHAGTLADRLRSGTNVGVKWVSASPENPV
jgi:hypothetical protein